MEPFPPSFLEGKASKHFFPIKEEKLLGVSFHFVQTKPGLGHEKKREKETTTTLVARLLFSFFSTVLQVFGKVFLGEKNLDQNATENKNKPSFWRLSPSGERMRSKGFC